MPVTGEAVNWTESSRSSSGIVHCKWDKSTCCWRYINPAEVKPPTIELRWLMPPKDEKKARDYLKVADACLAAGVGVPAEVLQFFGVSAYTLLPKEPPPTSTGVRYDTETLSDAVRTLVPMSHIDSMDPRLVKGLEILVKYKE